MVNNQTNRMLKIEHTPLVSIIVITYNSSKYVLETLESAKAQTYQNIELIITDDGSTDDTIQICEKWLLTNEKRFSRSKIVTVIKNTGTSANCNRGLRESKGDWIKIIAGDDLLLDTCISDNLDFTKTTPGMLVIHSNIIAFQDDKIIHSSLDQFDEKLLLKDSKTVLESTLKKFNFNTPSFFLNKDIFHKVGPYNEKYKLLEDYPFFCEVIYNNIKIHHLNKITVKYRLHNQSVTQTSSKLSLYNNFRIDQSRFLADNIERYSKLDPVLRHKLWNAKRIVLIHNNGLNKNKYFFRKIDSISYLSLVLFFKLDTILNSVNK